MHTVLHAQLLGRRGVPVQANVKVRYAELVDHTKPTPPDSPFLLTYDVSDFAGNAAPQQIRLVHVLCPLKSSDGGAASTTRQKLCVPDANNNDYYCTDANFCGVSSAGSADTSGQAALSNKAPVVTLNGPAVVQITQGTLYAVCASKSAVTDVPCDRGVEAIDAEDGDISWKVRACTSDPTDQTMEQIGLQRCKMSQSMAPGYYTITYYVQDKLGASASIERTLFVVARCDGGLTLCPDGKCYDDESCVGASGSTGSTPAPAVPVNTAPAIDLVVGDVLGSTVALRRGMAYEACKPGQQPLPGNLCEMGVTAIDAEDGDVGFRVYSCPPMDCALTCRNCTGHEFMSKGIKNCISTNQTIGAPMTIEFVVCDKGSPPLRNSTRRNFIIIERCPAPLYECDGACEEVPCDALNAVNSDQNPANTSPLLTLLPPPIRYPNGTILSGAGKPNSNGTTLDLEYGRAAPISVAPCQVRAAVGWAGPTPYQRARARVFYKYLYVLTAVGWHGDSMRYMGY